jgi:membrane-bound ClpP family serine protease
MINIKKVAHQLKFDGMYNTVYIEVQEELKSEDPSVEMIEELITSNEYYVNEYKELNRYGELSSVHAKELIIDENESDEIKTFKAALNDNVQQLRNLENFEVDSKNSAYSIWIGSAGVMIIFMAHNIVALFSELYHTHGGLVYGSFAIILGLTYWAYRKVKLNHEEQHKRYKLLHKETRAMIKEGLEKGYFSHEEFFEGVAIND